MGAEQWQASAEMAKTVPAAPVPSRPASSCSFTRARGDSTCMKRLRANVSRRCRVARAIGTVRSCYREKSSSQKATPTLTPPVACWIFGAYLRGTSGEESVSYKNEGPAARITLWPDWPVTAGVIRPCKSKSAYCPDCGYRQPGRLGSRAVCHRRSGRHGRPPADSGASVKQKGCR